MNRERELLEEGVRLLWGFRAQDFPATTEWREKVKTFLAAAPVEPRLSEELAHYKGRLYEFTLIKNERPADPGYWDKHEERRLRETIKDLEDALLAQPAPPGECNCGQVATEHCNVHGDHVSPAPDAPVEHECPTGNHEDCTDRVLTELEPAQSALGKPKGGATLDTREHTTVPKQESGEHGADSNLTSASVSRSVQRREALQKGEPMPTFEAVSQAREAVLAMLAKFYGYPSVEALLKESTCEGEMAIIIPWLTAAEQRAREPLIEALKDAREMLMDWAEAEFCPKCGGHLVNEYGPHNEGCKLNAAIFKADMLLSSQALATPSGAAQGGTKK